jgi:hypothetical protein
MSTAFPYSPSCFGLQYTPRQLQETVVPRPFFLSALFGYVVGIQLCFAKWQMIILLCDELFMTY